MTEELGEHDVPFDNVCFELREELREGKKGYKGCIVCGKMELYLSDPVR